MKKFYPIILFLFSTLLSKAGMNTPCSDSLLLIEGGSKHHITNCADFTGKQFGQITAGIRTGASALFDPKSIGYGIGFQVRYRFKLHWNLEVFTDYFNTDIHSSGYRHRSTYGADLIYYWAERVVTYKVIPFVFGGIFYDKSFVYSDEGIPHSDELPGFYLHAGYGIHYSLTPRFNLNLALIYALPLQEHTLTRIATLNNEQYLQLSHQSGPYPIGGIFAILSFNYCFGRL